MTRRFSKTSGFSQTFALSLAMGASLGAATVARAQTTTAASITNTSTVFLNALTAANAAVLSAGCQTSDQAATFQKAYQFRLSLIQYEIMGGDVGAAATAAINSFQNIFVQNASSYPICGSPQDPKVIFAAETAQAAPIPPVTTNTMPPVTVYAGVNGGGASTSSNASMMPGPGFGTVDGPKLATESQRLLHGSSATFGGRFGVDIAIPVRLPTGGVQILPFFGVFVDGGTSSSKAGVVNPFTSGTGAGTFPVNQSFASSTSVMVAGRAGFGFRLGATNIMVMPYALGGGVYQKITTAGGISFNTTFNQGASSQMRTGSVVGGGIAFKIAPGITIGPEFQHRDFGTIVDYAPNSRGTTTTLAIANANHVKEDRGMVNLTIDSSALGGVFARFR